ncbi:hypothetical protein MJT46_016537 [Ovis ammon polii x Ovis aries]|nr:hypothetical protein MJT46_016537 [Ovis ammon polii x Ovis aries]
MRQDLTLCGSSVVMLQIVTALIESSVLQMTPTKSPEEQLVTIHTSGKPPELKGNIASYRRSEVQLLVWCLRMILGERSKPSIYLLSSSLKLRDLKKEQSTHNGI